MFACKYIRTIRLPVAVTVIVDPAGVILGLRIFDELRVTRVHCTLWCDSRGHIEELFYPGSK